MIDLIDKINEALCALACGEAFDIKALLNQFKSELEVKHSTKHSVIVANSVHWFNPDTHPPLKGKKLTVLTWGGIQINSEWGSGPNGEDPYAAWAPLIEKPAWLKERLERHYLRNVQPWELPPNLER